jgi:hypothetical protein
VALGEVEEHRVGLDGHLVRIVGREVTDLDGVRRFQVKEKAVEVRFGGGNLGPRGFVMWWVMCPCQEPGWAV